MNRRSHSTKPLNYDFRGIRLTQWRHPGRHGSGKGPTCTNIRIAASRALTGELVTAQNHPPAWHSPPSGPEASTARRQKCAGRRSTGFAPPGGCCGITPSPSSWSRSSPTPPRWSAFPPAVIRISRERANSIRNWPDSGMRSGTNSGGGSCRRCHRARGLTPGHEAPAPVAAPYRRDRPTAPVLPAGQRRNSCALVLAPCTIRCQASGSPRSTEAAISFSCS